MFLIDKIKCNYINEAHLSLESSAGGTGGFCGEIGLVGGEHNGDNGLMGGVGGLLGGSDAWPIPTIDESSEIGLSPLELRAPMPMPLILLYSPQKVKRGRLISQKGQKENVVDFPLRRVKTQPNSVKNSVKKCLLPGSTIKDFAL